jgi:hypothetical protein
MAAAISNLGTGLIAQALLPLTVGILSDHMAAIMGSQALRYALTIVVTANLLAAACFVKAARLAKPVLAPEVTGISDEGARSIPKI